MAEKQDSKRKNKKENTSKEQKKHNTKTVQKSTNKQKKKRNTSKSNKKSKSKKSKVVMKSSNKNIITKATKLEDIDPIIIKYSSSNKNTLKKVNRQKKRINIKKILSKYKKNKIIIEKDEILNDKGWAVLSYICAPYVYIMKKDSSYVSYHTKKGMKIFYFEVLYLILYYLTKDRIKVTTSCDNFAHYDFSSVCKLTPWWVNFIWGVIALILVFIIVDFIKKVLSDDNISEEVLN